MGRFPIGFGSTNLMVLLNKETRFAPDIGEMHSNTQEPFLAVSCLVRQVLSGSRVFVK